MWQRNANTVALCPIARVSTDTHKITATKDVGESTINNTKHTRHAQCPCVAVITHAMMIDDIESLPREKWSAVFVLFCFFPLGRRNVTSSESSGRTPHTNSSPDQLRNFLFHPQSPDTFHEENGEVSAAAQTKVYNTMGVDNVTNGKKKSQILWAMCRDQVARASSVSPNVRQSVSVCVCVCVSVSVCARLDGASL